MSESFDALGLERQLIAIDLVLAIFPHQRRAAAFAGCRGHSMYTLNKAKEDIDLVAKHATDLAGHVMAMGGSVDAKLESFKAEILSVIETKFAELAKSIHGEGETAESSALADLGAKISLLTQSAHRPDTQAQSDEGAHAPQGDNGWHGDHSNGHQHHS